MRLEHQNLSANEPSNPRLFKQSKPYNDVVVRKAAAVEKELEAKEEFINAVRNGEVRAVEKLLAQKPNLAHLQLDFTDVIGTVYHRVTAFQYFFATGDRELCDVVVRSMLSIDTLVQMNALEGERDDIKIFTLDEMLMQYNTYIENYDAWNKNHRNDKQNDNWENLARLQRKLPLYLRYKFCAKGMEAPWAKKKNAELPSARNIDDCKFWNEKTEGGDVLIRGILPSCAIPSIKRGIILIHDRDGFASEKELIVEYRKSLRNRLEQECLLASIEHNVTTDDSDDNELLYSYPSCSVL